MRSRVIVVLVLVVVSSRHFTEYENVYRNIYIYFFKIKNIYIFFKNKKISNLFYDFLNENKYSHAHTHMHAFGNMYNILILT